MDGVTAVIPSIPPRHEMLARAIRSVDAQTHQATGLVVEIDETHAGAAATRNAGLARVATEWTAFLDDDDEWLPPHLEVLLAAAAAHEADVVWPWFEVVGGSDPFPGHRGRQFDIAEPHIFPICVLVRTELAQQTNGFQTTTGDWNRDDLPFYRDLWDLGARFHAVPDITWVWHHHGRNTSGQPERWQ